MTFDSMFNMLLILMVINITITIICLVLLIVSIIDTNYISNTTDNINLHQLYDETFDGHDCRECLGATFGDCFTCNKYKKNKRV
jgi:hypothetical protein